MASKAPLPAIRSVFNIDDTLGAALIGYAFACVVFGVLSTQCFIYYQRYTADKMVYKVLVFGTWTLELFHQILISHTVYYLTITNFANPIAILTGDVPWSLILQIIIGALVGTIVKGCFAMRVWRFSGRNKVVTGVLIILIFAEFGCAIAYSIRAFHLNKFIHAHRLKTIATVSLGAGALTDIVTAAALCFYLRRLRTGYTQSDSVVHTLTIYAINTGALTSAISLATVIAYNLNSSSFVFIGIYFVLSKMYAASFLGTLNTRKTVRGRGTDRQGMTSFGNSGTNVHMFGGQSFNMYVPRNQTKSQLEVGVHQEVSIVKEIDAVELGLPQTAYDYPAQHRSQPTTVTDTVNNSAGYAGQWR